MDGIIDFFKNSFLSLDSDISNITGILQEDWFSSGNLWYDFAMNIQTIINPIALIIVAICFLVEFLKITIQMDILKWEYALKCFFKLVFAKVCIELSTYVLGAIYTTSAEWIGSVGAGTVSIGQNVWSQIESDVSSAGLLEIIGIFLSSGIIFLAINIIVIVIQVMAYARKFEICILLSIAPLPCAFLPLEDGGASRIPKKYILIFASSCLAGLFMIMSVRLYALLVNEAIMAQIGTLTDFGSKVGKVLLATLVLVMAIIKSGGWASKVLDVG